MSESVTREKRMLQQVMLGIDATRLLGSKLGGFIQERCEEQREAALLELAETDPFDGPEIRRLQNEALVPLLVLQFINDAVQIGEQAELDMISQPE